MKTKLLLTFFVLSVCIVHANAQTTITLQPDPIIGKDAEVCLILPDSNFGNSQKMSPYAWTQDGNLNVIRDLIQFNLSAIPANATITSAKLTLYFNPYYTGITQHNGGNDLWIQRITAPWDENTVTWNNQPATTTTNQISIAPSSSSKQNYPDIDVSILLQDMLKNGNNNYGFMIKLQQESPYRDVLLASSDNTDASIRPKLVITYTSSSTICLTLQPDSLKGKDAEIGYISPDKNYGSSGKLSPYAWTQNNDLNIVRDFIEFDLSGLPVNAVVTDAKLSLYYNPNYPPLTEHTGDNALWIQRVTSPWDEYAVTWNNQPSTTTINQIQVPQSTSTKQDYPNIDVTQLVKDIQTAGNNYGFMIRLQEESPYRDVMLASSDNTDKNLHPKLQICYTTVAGITETARVTNKATIYPNPFNYSTTIQLSNKIDNAELSIFNVQGQLVKTIRNISGQEIKLVGDELTSGIYFIRLIQGNELIIADNVIVE